MEPEDWEVEMLEMAREEFGYGETMTDNRQKRACVLVLGDVGRSPRMNYHALSLAAHGYHVDLVGYGGSQPHEKIVQNPAIRLQLMQDVPEFISKVPRLLAYVLKVIWQTFALFLTLVCLQKPDVILVQNPPSIPTLPVTWFYCRLRGCQFLIDWHNYGYSILSLALHKKHPLVQMCYWMEGFYGRKADGNFCVTKALQMDLESKMGVKAVVLYDRPASIFKPLMDSEKHELLSKLKESYSALGSLNPEETAITSYSGAGDQPIKLKSKRPALVVSSTSWTPDEDLNLLLDALLLYDAIAENNQSLPDVICIITGKGPMKSAFQERLSTKNFKRVKFILPWLEAGDYPKLLGSCDLGVSLHMSSSNLDLPMKVVDMFGCCLPVCAYRYPCLDELVKDGQNGLTFEASEELCDHLVSLLTDFPTKKSRLREFRRHLMNNFAKVRWNDSWHQIALPIIENSSDN